MASITAMGSPATSVPSSTSQAMNVPAIGATRANATGSAPAGIRRVCRTYARQLPA